RRELDGERARERGEAGLGDGVNGVAPERTLGMDVDDVDDRARVLRELRSRLLADEERRAQVGADELFPVRKLDGTHLDREEARGVVDEEVEAAETLQRGRS